MMGTFLETPADAHVSLRASLLCSSIFPAPNVPIINALSESFDQAFPLVEASLRTHGLSIVQLDRPLDSAHFSAFAKRLGPLVPESAVEVQPYVENGNLLHLRVSSGPTDVVGLQPFSSGYLTMHSESSGNAVADQPKYIAFQCLEAGDPASDAKTILTPMASVVARLSQNTIDVLSRTRYDTDRNSPPLLRYEGQRWVVSFRDFQGQRLAWTHNGPSTAAEVAGAIRELLAAIYACEGVCAVHWTRGLLVVLDNQMYLHARSKARFEPCGQQRHLLRARIRQPTGNIPGETYAAGASDLSCAARLFARQLPRQFPDPAKDFKFAYLREDLNDLGEVEAPFLDERTLEVFARAQNPTNHFELRDLWLGRVEAELGHNALRPELANMWRNSRVHRTVAEEEVLNSTATVAMVKEMFNTFFRDDLYGALHSKKNIILSSGSVDEEEYGLPTALKEAIHFALTRNLYGYSDSRGHEYARQAVAAMESARMQRGSYTSASVVMTMGATQAISSLADFILCGKPQTEPALCAIPNYPPLVQAIARHRSIRLVPTPSHNGLTSLKGLRQAVSPSTPLVMLQTGANPCGSLVTEYELQEFIESTSPQTIVILDETHEWLGAPRRFSSARQRSNVLRVKSLSKEWSAPGLKVGWFLADPAFVSEYYEFASTSYGGPPSLMCTLVEVLARFERWLTDGKTTIGQAEVGEFSANYGLQLSTLIQAYESYIGERQIREQRLFGLREAAVRGLREAAMKVKPPRVSLNVFAEILGYEDSYHCFRTLLRETGVSVYPSILNFRLAGGGFRVSTARKWGELSEGLERLAAWQRVRGLHMARQVMKEV